jgi:tight adherence protein B
LSAGKSIELAFKDIQKDLALLYPGRTGYIVHELERINIKFGMNEPVEEVMLDFATRTDIEEIVTFADILAASKRTGGNLIEIIKNTSKTISEKLEFRMELDVLLAERKFEQKVMGLFPFLIILVLSAMAPDYMEPVFNTFLGNLVMTCILVVFVIAWQIGAKIVDIEV